jgi:hypothetical protein
MRIIRRRFAALTVVMSMMLLGLAAAAPAQETLFHDAFMQGLGKWNPMTCCWQVMGYDVGKLLRQKSADAKLINTKVLISERNFEDCTIETKVRFGAFKHSSIPQEKVDRLGAGLILGYRDDNNFYIFRLAGEDKVVLGVIANGEWKPLGVRNDGKPVRRPKHPLVDNLEDSPWIVLKAVISNGGHKIVGYVDGDPQVESDMPDSPAIMGGVGFTTFNSMADFAYMTITGK